METKPTFAPQLVIPDGVTDVDFYINAFGATELRRFSNDDGTIHVSELSINGAMFHLHQENNRTGALSPQTSGSFSTTIGLFVDDVHAVVAQAIAAGATLTNPVQDYDYGYRQGDVRDPYGHIWMIEKAI